MQRSLAMTALVGLVGLAGCQSAGPSPSVPAPPSTPPMIGSASWQPGYLTAAPVSSSYSLVSAPPAPARLVPVAASPMPPRPKAAAVEPPRRLRVTVAGARAPDYRWLIGRLEHDARSDRLYVRYGDASADAHGGVLELVGVKVSPGLVPGQMVRVEGERVGPAATGAHPVYRAATIQQMSVRPGAGD